MTKREKYFAAMRRQSESYVPFDFYLCPSLSEEFKKRTGKTDPIEYYQFANRGFSVEYTGKKDKFTKYYSELTNISLDQAWGVGYKKGSVQHFTEMQHPMEKFESLKDFENYPYPDPARDFDWASVPAKVAALQKKDISVTADMPMTIFEIAWYMRGIEVFLMDLLANPDFANYHLDRITGIRCEMASRYAQAGFDQIQLGDDVSTQLNMMMHVDTWREYLKPRLAKVIAAAKSAKPDMLVFYHGDGNLQEIIPELIEIGVDILNPVQPECMDPVEVKKKYGSRLSFWGTLGTQTTLPFGTPQDVKKMCEKMIKEVGRGGGLGLAPTHLLEPEVPWDNIQAFVDTVTEYNNR
jgi:uroporphyrinogen decarboxylase